MLRFLTLKFLFCCSSLLAADVSFGFFKNYGKRKDIDKLQLLLPLSIANQLKAKSSHSVQNPIETQRRLLKNDKPLKLIYEDRELKKLTKLLGADVFVYGGYSLNRREYIINLKVYFVKRSQILSVDTRGRLGQSVTNSVKLLQSYIEGFLATPARFLSEKIDKGKKLCLITNLGEIDNNKFAMTFLKKGYRVCSLGFNDFNFLAGNETIPFYSMVGTFAALDSVLVKPKDFGQMNLSILKKNEKDLKLGLQEQQHLYDYSVGYFKKKSAKMKKLQKQFQADYLLIYNQAKRPAGKIKLRAKNDVTFARAINLKNGNLVYAQDKFKSPFFGGSDIESRAGRLITEIQTLKEIKKESLRKTPRRPDSQKQEEGSAADEDKAIVAILNFYDRTGTQSYTWMSTSLADAINKSMLQVFEFNRAAPEKTQTQSDEILKGAQKINKDILKALQQKTGVDYVVFGSYTYSEQTKKITVTAAVYDLYTYDKIGEALATTDTDMSLFSSVDTVAQKIVKDIFKFAAGQDTEAGKKVAGSGRQFIVIKKGIISKEAANKKIEEQAESIRFDRYDFDWQAQKKDKK